MAAMLRQAVETIFGAHPFGDALFYTRPGGLRFELSDGGAPLDQVLTALRKATAICADLFAAADTMTVCLRLYAYEQDSLFGVRATLRALAEMGIPIPREREIWACVPPREDPDVRYVHVAFTLPVSKLQNLLWAAVVHDFRSIRPNPGCSAFLVNIEAQLMAHPYDDRGMDIVGPDSALLRQLYVKYNHHLLDHDLAAMDATFAPAKTR